MSKIYVHGCGAVSPAGWDVASLIETVSEKRIIAPKELKRPGWAAPLLVRVVPPAAPRPAFLSHPRLRRASAITHYAVSTALEALGAAASKVNDGSLRLGVIFCVLTGCVNYSRRFYDEAWHDPATASPLLFPETVFNAPSSHLAALLGSQEINYTLVGDPGTFLQALALAAEWLTHEPLDGCLVVGAEELEWLAVDAYRLSAPKVILSEGAGALYLTRETPRAGEVELAAVTDPHLFFSQQSRIDAAKKVQTGLRASGPAELLCDGLQGVPKLDAPEQAAWASWAGERISPKMILGEGLMAAAAWQCVAAAEALRRGSHRTAHVSIVGCNEQAIGASFNGAV